MARQNPIEMEYTCVTFSIELNSGERNVGRKPSIIQIIMWRNSLSFSSKFLIHNSYSLPSSISKGVRPLLLSQYESFLGYSLSVKFVGLQPSHDGLRAVSASSVDFSSLSAFSVKKASDLARHFGHCYWELSKARLSMLVVATSGTGFVLGNGSVVDLSGLCWTCAGTMMAAALIQLIKSALRTPCGIVSV